MSDYKDKLLEELEKEDAQQKAIDAENKAFKEWWEETKLSVKKMHESMY